MLEGRRRLCLDLLGGGGGIFDFPSSLLDGLVRVGGDTDWIDEGRTGKGQRINPLH